MTQAEAKDAELGARIPSVLDSVGADGLAVRATFDPEQSVPPDAREVIRIVSDEVIGQQGKAEWMLKEHVRADLLARMVRRGPEELLRVRQAQVDVIPGALQSVLDMFIERRPLDIDHRSEAELVAALHVIRWAVIATSLASRPDLVPEGFVRDEVEGKLAVMETLRPIREATADGCFGRDLELSRLHDYLDQTEVGSSLYDVPAMLVYGVGGVGKSTLVSWCVRDIAETRDPPAWAYLDLDRPSLASFEPMSLLRDIARQVGTQFPAIRRALDNEALLSTESSRGAGVESRGRERWLLFARNIARLLAKASAGRLVIVLDTYEELQRYEARTSSHKGDELYRMFARLSDGLRQFRLVVSGRAPAASFVASGATRVPQQVIKVGPLQPAAAELALQVFYEHEMARSAKISNTSASPIPRLSPAVIGEVVRTVGRSPLTLKLAARVLVREGGAAVHEAADAAHAARRAYALERIRADFVDGFLYHRILRHLNGVGTIEPEMLRRIARASIPLRRITKEIMERVVLPVVGATTVRTDEVIASLAAEAAFAEIESDGLRLRDELRRPALLALRFSEPALVAEVHRRAAEYYADLADQPAAAVEHVYHQLAGGLSIDLRLLTPEVVHQLEDSLDEFVADGRDLVAAALRGPSAMQEESGRQALQREVEAAVSRALASGDLSEAERLLSDRVWWTPTTTLHSSLSLVAEQRGDLGAAVDAAHGDQAAAERARDPFRFVAAAVRCAHLEERMHGGEDGAAVLAGADGRPWLGGQPMLLLELRLNRHAMLERHGLPYDQWLERLETRALLSRCDLDVVRETTSVVRLLAASLGEEEPRLVLDAVRAIGLGAGTGSPQQLAVAEALAAWDVEPSPGSVARQVGLRMPEPVTEAGLRAVWVAAVASPSTDVIVSLDRAFAIRSPDTRVLAALRQVYLWWGVDLEPVLDRDRISSRDVPLDALFLRSGPDFTLEPRLVQVLRGAYPKPEDLRALASRAGIDLANISWRATPERLVTNVLQEADRSGRLIPLLGQILTDPVATSFLPELWAIVGPDWLRDQGVVDLYYRLGMQAQDRGDDTEAEHRYQQALAIGEQLGDPRATAMAWGRIADIALRRGEYDEALRIRREVELPVYERLGDTRSTAVAWGRIADIALRRGEYDEALRIRREVELPVYERLGDTRSTAMTWGEIADIAYQRGDFVDAANLHHQQLQTGRQVGDLNSIAAATWGLAQIDLARNDHDSAASRLAEAFQILQRLGRADGIAIIGWTLGQLLLAAGTDQAREVLTAAAEAASRIGMLDLARQITELLAQARIGDA